MKIKHLIATLAGIGLSLISLSMSAQITVTVTDNAAGSKNTHKIRFDYVICDSANKIVNVESSEFQLNNGGSKTVTLTAPAGYHVDPVVHLQLRQKPNDDHGTKWHNSPRGLGTFYVTGNKINLVIEGSSKSGYDLLVGAGSSPKFTIDTQSSTDFINAQNSNKGQLSLGGKQIEKEKSQKALEQRKKAEEKAAAEKKAAEEKAAREKAAADKAAAEKAAKERAEREKKAAEERAAQERERNSDFNKVTTGSKAGDYLNRIKVVVKDETSAWTVSSPGIKLRLDYVICDANTHKVKSVDYQTINITPNNHEVITRDFSAPAGCVIRNGKIHYELSVRYTRDFVTHSTGTLEITNTWMNSTPTLKIAVAGVMNNSNSKLSINRSVSSPFLLDNNPTTGEQFKKLNTPEPEKPKVVTELKVNFKDLETAAREDHKVRIDYVICDKKTDAVKSVKFEEVTLQHGVPKTVTRTVAAPADCYIRSDVHCEIRTGAAPNLRLTDAGIFKIEPGKELNITMMLTGVSKDVTVKTAESSPFSVDRPLQSGPAFNKSNQPK